MSTASRSKGPVSAAIKPLLRRPSLIRKRDDVDSFASEEAKFSSPGKRMKVTFDNDVEVRLVSDWGKAPNLIREEVRRAIEKHAIGDDSEYNGIKAVYSAEPDAEDCPSSSTMKNYTSALLANISSLNTSCSSLVDVVLNSQWLGREYDYVTLYVRFLANVVSVQGGTLPKVLGMLVDNLTSTPPSSGRIPSLPVVPRSQINIRVHSALQYLLQLVPSASRTISSIFTSKFPHATDSRKAHVSYARNLLRVLAYAPELEADVLALITERLVKIDVQVQVDLEDLAEDVGDGLVQEIPKVLGGLIEDVDEMEDSENESESTDDAMDTETQRSKDITTSVEKMDLLLDVLFTHYNSTFTGTSVTNRFCAFDMLLSQFTTIILPTHRSRHTQFLLFHFAQTSSGNIDTFVGTCMEIAFDKRRPAIMRQGAVAYLASFVARGIRVPPNVVRDVFDYIGCQLEQLRAEYEPACRGPDLGRYTYFYSLVQALLYIFCFRWQDLENSADEEDFEDEDLPTDYGEEHTWRSGVKETLAINVFSKLNPLKVCSPIIVTEFARIANHLGVIYVFHLLETNKRVRLSQFSGSARSSVTYNLPHRETALSARKDESHQHLDEYFPFDPYHLPKSKRWIEGDYREWTGIPGLGDEQADDTESDEEDVDDSEVDEDTETDEGSES